MTRSPLTLPSVRLSRRQFRARLGAAVLDAIEAVLDGSAPEQAGLRRALRRMKDDLLASEEINILHPDTQQGVLGLVAAGLCSSAHAVTVLSYPPDDILPLIPAPPGTVEARWDGWRVWAVQVPPGDTWSAQTPDGDVTLTYPDFLVTHQLGGAQYRARATEVDIL